MAFYISHDSFITGDNKEIHSRKKEDGKVKTYVFSAPDNNDDNVADVGQSTNTDKQNVVNNVMKQNLKRKDSKKIPTKAVNASVKGTENKQQEVKSAVCEPKKTVTFTKENKSPRKDQPATTGECEDSQSEDYAIAEGMKTEIYIKIETVENVTLPLRENERKLATPTSHDISKQEEDNDKVVKIECIANEVHSDYIMMEKLGAQIKYPENGQNETEIEIMQTATDTNDNVLEILETFDYPKLEAVDVTKEIEIDTDENVTEKCQEALIEDLTQCLGPIVRKLLEGGKLDGDINDNFERQKDEILNDAKPETENIIQDIEVSGVETENGNEKRNKTKEKDDSKTEKLRFYTDENDHDTCTKESQETTNKDLEIEFDGDEKHIKERKEDEVKKETSGTDLFNSIETETVYEVQDIVLNYLNSSEPSNQVGEIEVDGDENENENITKETQEISEKEISNKVQEIECNGEENTNTKGKAMEERKETNGGELYNDLKAETTKADEEIKFHTNEKENFNKESCEAYKTKTADKVFEFAGDENTEVKSIKERKEAKEEELKVEKVLLKDNENKNFTKETSETEIVHEVQWLELNDVRTETSKQVEEQKIDYGEKENLAKEKQEISEADIPNKVLEILSKREETTNKNVIKKTKETKELLDSTAETSKQNEAMKYNANENENLLEERETLTLAANEVQEKELIGDENENSIEESKLATVDYLYKATGTANEFQEINVEGDANKKVTEYIQKTKQHLKTKRTTEIQDIILHRDETVPEERKEEVHNKETVIEKAKENTEPDMLNDTNCEEVNFHEDEVAKVLVKRQEIPEEDIFNEYETEKRNKVRVLLRSEDTECIMLVEHNNDDIENQAEENEKIVKVEEIKWTEKCNRSEITEKRKDSKDVQMIIDKESENTEDIKLKPIKVNDDMQEKTPFIPNTQHNTYTEKMLEDELVFAATLVAEEAGEALCETRYNWNEVDSGHVKERDNEIKWLNTEGTKATKPYQIQNQEQSFLLSCLPILLLMMTMGYLAMLVIRLADEKKDDVNEVNVKMQDELVDQFAYFDIMKWP